MSRPHTGEAVITATHQTGAYFELHLQQQWIARHVQPGQFVAFRVGDGLLHPIRRFASVIDANPDTGTFAVLISPRDNGTRWIAQQAPHATLNVLGPLGNHFDIRPNVLFVGAGHGTAAIGFAATRAASQTPTPRLVLGAATHPEVYLSDTVKAIASTIELCVPETPTDPFLPDLLDAVRRHLPTIDAIHASGPMPMLKALTVAAAPSHTPVTAAVETRMACAWGACMSCVLPIYNADNVIENTRTCVTGPVIDTAAIAWA